MLRLRALGLLGLLGLASTLAAGCREGEPLPGDDPSKLDPVAVYGKVRSYAGVGVELTQLSVDSMHLDGTVDLDTKTYKAKVTYHFVRPIEAPEDAPPPGASGSSPDGTWHQTVAIQLDRPGTSWHVSEMGGKVNREYTIISKGMIKTESEPQPGAAPETIPAPGCSFGELWQKVDTSKIPSDAVVDAMYSENGYELRDTVNSESYWFDFECAPMAEPE